MLDEKVVEYNKHIKITVDSEGLYVLALSKKLLALDLGRVTAHSGDLNPNWGWSLTSNECKLLGVKKKRFKGYYIDEEDIYNSAEAVLAAYEEHKLLNSRDSEHIKWVGKHIAIVTDLDGHESLCLSNKLLAADLCINGVRLDFNYGWGVYYHALWPSDIKKAAIKGFRGSFMDFFPIHRNPTKCAKIIKKAYKQYKKEKKKERELVKLVDYGTHKEVKSW